MKNIILYLVLTVLVLFTGYMYYSLQQLQKEKEAMKQKLNDYESSLEEKQEEIEVADIMTKLQRHTNKLWYAGKAKNWELADFYVTELKEAMEEITEHNVKEEGVNISELMKMMGVKSLQPVDDAIKSQDFEAFKEKYNLLIQSCNDCHNSAKYGFVKISKPSATPLSNQEFSGN